MRPGLAGKSGLTGGTDLVALCHHVAHSTVHGSEVVIPRLQTPAVLDDNHVSGVVKVSGEYHLAVVAGSHIGTGSGSIVHAVGDIAGCGLAVEVDFTSEAASERTGDAFQEAAREVTGILPLSHQFSGLGIKCGNSGIGHIGIDDHLGNFHGGGLLAFVDHIEHQIFLCAAVFHAQGVGSAGNIDDNGKQTHRHIVSCGIEHGSGIAHHRGGELNLIGIGDIFHRDCHEFSGFHGVHAQPEFSGCGDKGVEQVMDFAAVGAGGILIPFCVNIHSHLLGDIGMETGAEIGESSVVEHGFVCVGNSDHAVVGIHIEVNGQTAVQIIGFHAVIDQSGSFGIHIFAVVVDVEPCGTVGRYLIGSRQSHHGHCGFGIEAFGVLTGDEPLGVILSDLVGRTVGCAEIVGSGIRGEIEVVFLTLYAVGNGDVVALLPQQGVGECGNLLSLRLETEEEIDQHIGFIAFGFLFQRNFLLIHVIDGNTDGSFRVHGGILGLLITCIRHR